VKKKLLYILPNILPMIFISACSGGGQRHASDHVVGSVQKQDLYYTYTVEKDGETLASVARRLTGSAANWHLLAKLNQNLSSYRLKKGDKITISEGLLVDPKQRSLLTVSVTPPEEATPLEDLRDKYEEDLKVETVEPLKMDLSVEGEDVAVTTDSDTATELEVEQEMGQGIEQEEPHLFDSTTLQPTPTPDKRYKEIRDQLLNEFINE
jgi:hypothetical protein